MMYIIFCLFYLHLLSIFIVLSFSFFFFFFFIFFFFFFCFFFFFFFFQAEDGIRDFCLSRGLGDVYKRQLQYRLDKILDRLHILEGLMVAFLNIDEVIRIVRTEDKPKAVLMKQFKISDLQACLLYTSDAADE